MSNPGVITLSSKKIGHHASFRVEDNLGESIHFHYNDIRVDLTIPELLNIADTCDEAIRALIPCSDFDPDEYDPEFLNRYSQYLIDLERIEERDIPASELYIQSRGLFGLPVTRRIRSLSSSHRQDGEGKEETPILFNDSKVLMSGADSVRALDGAVTVRIFHFRKNKHSVSRHPWIKYLFKWDAYRIRDALTCLYIRLKGRKNG